MKLIDRFKLNREIYHAINSCDPKEFNQLIARITSADDDYIIDAFTSKWFIWNRLRGRDFYRMMADYVAEQVQRGADIGAYDKADQNEYALQVGKLVSLIRKTCYSDKVYKNFVHGVNKKCIVLTIDTIPFIPNDKLEVIVANMGNKPMLVDDKLQILMRLE